MLASYFPKPSRPTLGPWALDQAKGLANAGADLKVLSLTPWLPKGIFKSEAGRAIATCPDQHNWEGLIAEYPRWFYYHMNPIRRFSYPNPGPYLQTAYATVKDRLHKIARNYQPDILFAHHSAVNGYVAARLNESTGVPFVVTDHSFEELWDCQRFPKRKAVLKSVAERAGRMIGVCDRMERLTKSLFPSAKTSTVLNGVPAPDPACALEPRPAALSGKRVLFSAGLFYARKSFPLLIDAFAEVSKRVPDSVLRIAGDGTERSKVEERIRAHGLEEKVTLLGLQPRTRVLQEHAWADAFALLGHDEPFGVVFAEAMAAGKPIVCANDAGINDAATNGVNVLAVTPGDKSEAADRLTRLLQDTAFRDRIGCAGNRLFRERLTLNANARQMIRIFEEEIVSCGQTNGGRV